MSSTLSLPESLLSQKLSNLTAFIRSCAVPQGTYSVIRGNAVRELSERVRHIVEAVASRGARPEDPALVQVCRELSRLREAANGAFSGCIDVRLETPPDELCRLFDLAAGEVQQSDRDRKLTACSTAISDRERPVGRDDGLRRSYTRRQVPKQVEMRGKASQLLELVRDEGRTGRTITKMCQMVGISRETFQKSKHFADARLAWQQLRESKSLRSKADDSQAQ
jgi:hypothetical protein